MIVTITYLMSIREIDVRNYFLVPKCFATLV